MLGQGERRSCMENCSWRPALLGAVAGGQLVELSLDSSLVTFREADEGIAPKLARARSHGVEWLKWTGSR